MNTCLSKPTRRSTCKTSSAKAVSSAAKFPVCLSRRFCASIPTASQAVNVPEIIVHGATPLPISKTPICLEAVNPGVLGAFQ